MTKYTYPDVQFELGISVKYYFLYYLVSQLFVEMLYMFVNRSLKIYYFIDLVVNKEIHSDLNPSVIV